MPEYEYEALDASGKSVTGTISCRDEQQALDGLDKSGLHPTKLTLREKAPRASINKYYNGTSGDAFGWIFWGAVMPLIGVISGFANSEKTHPAVAIIVTLFISFYVISNRLDNGEWLAGADGGPSE
jgi:hypothetical protein